MTNIVEKMGEAIRQNRRLQRDHAVKNFKSKQPIEDPYDDACAVFVALKKAGYAILPKVPSKIMQIAALNLEDETPDIVKLGGFDYYKAMIAAQESEE